MTPALLTSLPQLEWWIDLAAIVAFALLLLSEMHTWNWRRLLVLGGALALTGAAWLLVPPALTHANGHGVLLLEQLLTFPKPIEFHDTYGQGSAVFHGGLGALLGGTPTDVFNANTLIALAALGAASLLAERLTRGAGAFTFALGAAHPALVLSARSEEAHITGIFWGLVVLLIVDRIRTGDLRLRTLGLLATSLVLVSDSRQTFVPWGLLVLLILWPSIRDPQARRKLWMTAGLTLLLLMPRALHLLFSSHEYGEYGLVFRSFYYVLVPSSLIHNSFFRSVPGILTVALALWGVLRLRQATTLVMAGAALFYLVLTLPFDLVAAIGARYGYRTPALALMLPLAGLGAVQLYNTLKPKLRGHRAIAVVACLLVWAGGTLKIHYEASMGNPSLSEYEIVQAHIPDLDRSLQLGIVVPPYLLSDSSSSKMSSVFARQGVPFVREWSDDGPLPDQIFLEAACWTISLPDLIGRPTGEKFNEFAYLYGGGGFLERMGQMYDLHTSPNKLLARRNLQVPQGVRQECLAAIPEGWEFEYWGEIRIFRHELPMIIYTDSRIPLGLWRPAGSTQGR